METAPGGPTLTTADIERHLLDALGQIRAHWSDLLEPTKTGGTGGPSNDEVTSLDRRVSLRHETTMLLNSWARVIVDDANLTHHLPLGTDALGMVTLLERHARWFSGHEAAEAASDELTDMARRVASAAAPKAREWVTLGDCPFVVEDWFCSGHVRVPTAGGDPRCSDCGQETVLEWWLAVLGVVPTITRDDLPEFIRREFGRVVSGSTVRRLLIACALMPCGIDAEGRPLFDRGAVAYALTKRWAA